MIELIQYYNAVQRLTFENNEHALQKILLTEADCLILGTRCLGKTTMLGRIASAHCFLKQKKIYYAPRSISWGTRFIRQFNLPQKTKLLLSFRDLIGEDLNNSTIIIDDYDGRIMENTQLVNYIWHRKENVENCMLFASSMASGQPIFETGFGYIFNLNTRKITDNNRAAA